MANGIEKTGARSDGHTVIGGSLVFDGEISGGEDVVVVGHVKGRVTVDRGVFVEPSGVVDADVEAATLEVSGQVNGTIAARERVELRSDCKVVGDVRSPRILIADGAVFQGSVDMDVKGK